MVQSFINQDDDSTQFALKLKADFFTTPSKQ